MQTLYKGIFLYRFRHVHMLSLNQLNPKVKNNYLHNLRLMCFLCIIKDSVQIDKESLEGGETSQGFLSAQKPKLNKSNLTFLNLI